MAVKIRYSKKFQPRFVKNSGIIKKNLLISYLLKESASSSEQANRTYGGLKLGVFVTKGGPFCPNLAGTFWKILPDILYTISGWIFEKVIDSYKPGVPSTPLPNFPVSSSYKNGNCLNIRTSLDILDNRHPRK